MKLSDLNTAVSRIADTAPKGSTITAPDCSRVIACMFDVLAELPACEALDLVAKGLASAQKRKGSKSK